MGLATAPLRRKPRLQAPQTVRLQELVAMVLMAKTWLWVLQQRQQEQEQQQEQQQQQEQDQHLLMRRLLG